MGHARTSQSPPQGQKALKASGSRAPPTRSSRSQTECPGLSSRLVPTPASLSSHHSCLPAPGHVLREALTCRGEGQVQAQPGPRAQRCHLSGGDGPSQGNFSAQIESWRRDRRCPTDTCVLPPILQVGAWRSHTERRAKARSWTRVSRPPSSRGSFTADCPCPHLCPQEEMDGGKGRKGRKESRLVFKRSVLKKHFLSLSPTGPALSRCRLASGTTLASLLHGPRGCRYIFQSQLEGGWLKSQMWKTVRRFSKSQHRIPLLAPQETENRTTPTLPAVSFTAPNGRSNRVSTGGGTGKSNANCFQHGGILLNLNKEGDSNTSCTHRENIMLSEISVQQKDGYSDDSVSMSPEGCLVHRDRNSGCQGLGEGRGWGVSAQWGAKFQLGKTENVSLELDGEGDGTRMRMNFTPLNLTFQKGLETVNHGRCI